MPLQPDSEEYWRAQSDARTLVEAESVKADGKRLSAATEILNQQEEARKAAIKSATSAAKKLG